MGWHRDGHGARTVRPRPALAVAAECACQPGTGLPQLLAGGGLHRGGAAALLVRSSVARAWCSMLPRASPTAPAAAPAQRSPGHRPAALGTRTGLRAGLTRAPRRLVLLPSGRYEFFADDLPIWGFVGPPPEQTKGDSNVYIYTHKTLDIAYNGDRVGGHPGQGGAACAWSGQPAARSRLAGHCLGAGVRPFTERDPPPAQRTHPHQPPPPTPPHLTRRSSTST